MPRNTLPATAPVPPQEPRGGALPQDPTAAPASTAGWASFAGRVATGVAECVDVLAEPERLATGTWFIVADFEGRARAWRFTEVLPAPAAGETVGGRPASDGGWHGPAAGSWRSSLDRAGYEAAVARVREHVRDGDVYQANICRVLSAPLPARGGEGGGEPDAQALTARLAAGNPAPHAAAVHVPASSGVEPVWVVSASPELYLSVDPGPDGPVAASGPIKGTARTPDGLTDKDRAENIMITDLVRNDLQRACRPGTVEVTSLLALERHPGLVHLVSRVQGVLREDITGPDLWRHLFEATFPPGSVSGAPKSSALRIIGELEPVPRGPYCGAVGWVDGDAGTASLAVGIRTFWWTPDGGGVLRFGTGAGITWGSDPAAEWHETELKAERLIGLASS
ncbi:chorismate-binding protein [Antribacter sp. KLBMP9083]|uniref:Chorismate-binding protein n=1 Tax=Antribacter soli TaxID=2910976 RepID=A0AA41QEA4_9MICO|nr:chorismate-binding protein [Antribacter soli]MCF4121885.1 chorismate-binding protein [Antribacter soli]